MNIYGNEKKKRRIEENFFKQKVCFSENKKTFSNEIGFEELQPFCERS